MAKQTKYIFVTGGVLSSLGKGLASASIGMLLERRGLKITIQKLDPYINVDPGTMNPFEHGEVYVTEDGTETDLDLGHYERFTNAKLTKQNNFTTGKIYDQVIKKEREGEYLGHTVQVIPHITNEIKQSIELMSKDDIDIAIIEIGGTIGDIESLPFLEAIRQFRTDVGYHNVLYLHLTYVPYIQTAGEVKTKPTQHSVKELRSIGIQPDILLCRINQELEDKLKEKIALFCNVSKNSVFTARDIKCIYEVPIIYNEEGLDDKILEKLGIETKKPDLEDWRSVIKKIQNPKYSVKIGVVGKYVQSRESYKSLFEALTHGGVGNNAKVEFNPLDASEITDYTVYQTLSEFDGILVPGGFGRRGFKGKVLAAKYARENNIPFFGICYGLHAAVIEIAKNVAGIENADTEEFGTGAFEPVIYFMSRWYDSKTKQIETRYKDSNKGASMRLGAYQCKIFSNTLAMKAYQQDEIYERHRHRYEFNSKYKEQLEKAGIIASGICKDPRAQEKDLVEIIELKNHPWYLCCQFHPEFQSKPDKPHPLFKDFIKASLEKNNGKNYE